MSNATQTSVNFNYEILKETEKAILAKVPYYELTSELKKKNTQLWYECWIPKSVIEKGDIKQFVIGSRNEKRLQGFQKFRCEMPNYWLTLGEYAPEKTAINVVHIDYEKVKELTSIYERKYGCFSHIWCDEVDKDGNDILDCEMAQIKALSHKLSFTNPLTPKKHRTIYIGGQFLGLFGCYYKSESDTEPLIFK